MITKPLCTSLLAYIISISTYAQTDIRINSVPFVFIENKGQIKDFSGKSKKDILYVAKNNELQFFVAKNSLCYQFSYAKKEQMPVDTNGAFELLQHMPATLVTYRTDVRLLNANPYCSVVGEQLNDYYENYYLPDCEDVTHVNTYSKIVMKNVYPQIDWIIYSNSNTLEYDFVVHPGGRPADIQLQYDSTTFMGITEEGDLNIKNFLGSILEHKPFSYQADKEVKSSFKLNSNTVSFAINEYDKMQDLVIDPSITWATYYGGSDKNEGWGTTTDKLGNIYLSGITNSWDNVASQGFQDTFKTNGDCFLVKFNNLGQRLWATYYGGSKEDLNGFVTVDDTGNVFLSGYTISANVISTNNAWQPTFNQGGFFDYDAFLVKFNANGKRLWGTYYGDVGNDVATACATDKNGNVYMTGYTDGGNQMISANCFQSNLNGAIDAFIVKFNGMGKRIWGTFYGGNGRDYADKCRVDDSGNVYTVGYSQSSNVMGIGGFQPNNGGGGADGFLAKFDSSGNRKWGTFIGGLGYDETSDCAIDKYGNVYMCGRTYSSSNVAYNGFQNIYGGNGYYPGDGFVVKMNVNGARQWATYYGGSSVDWAVTCAVDKHDNLYIAGTTASTNNISKNGFQNTYGGDPGSTISLQGDAFIAKIDGACNRIWGTYYGGVGIDEITDCTIDTFDNIYVAGFTSSYNNISKDGFRNNWNIYRDAFLSKLSTYNCIGKDTASVNININPDTAFCAGSFRTFTASTANAMTGISYEWYINNSSAAINYTGIFTTDQLHNGDSISCYMRSSDTCLASNIAKSNLIDVTVWPLPTPGIKRTGDSLQTTDTFSTYQWIFNGQTITGAGNRIYVADTLGDYSVIVTDANGCSDTSAVIHVTMLNSVNTIYTQAIQIYPVPVHNLLVIDSKEVYNVMLYTIDGYLLRQHTTSSPMSMLDLPSGLYLLYLSDNEGHNITVRKIVKE